jgi:hypothetical protein
MIARACIVIMLAVFGFAAVVAQGTDSERAACQSDVKKICPGAINQGPLQVAACLAANKAQLSPRCRAVLASHGF